MGRLQSSIGLITGTDIVGTVDQLMRINAQPRDRLLSRTETLQAERQSLAELTASVIGVQLAGNQLSLSSSFQSKSATSSDEEALSALAGTNATPASHAIRTIQTAATHAVASRQRFDSDIEALGVTGTLAIQTEGFLNQSEKLADLNDGRGVEPGRIRITDRSGRSDVVDLTNVATFDDVVQAINDADIDVTATTQGGRLKLIDNTGSTDSNLIVEQLGTAETSADLGIYGINEATDVVLGHELSIEQSLVSANDVSLADLGVNFADEEDLTIQFADGTSLDLALSDVGTPPVSPIGTTDAGNVNARITFEGVNGDQEFDGLEVNFVNDILLFGPPTFELSGSGTDQVLTVTINQSQTTANDVIDLINNDTSLAGRLTATAVGTGNSNVNQNDVAELVGDPGEPAITPPVTISELVDRLNAAAPSKLSASLNENNEIGLVDLTTGGSAFTIGDLSTSTVASALNLDIPSGSDTITSSVIPTPPPEPVALRGVLLSELNGGQGLSPLGTIDITTSDGNSTTVDLSSATTTSEVIDAIAASTADIIVGLNDAGTGFRLRDVSGGTGNFAITSGDETADKLGLAADTSDPIVVGKNLERQTVTTDTTLASLNGGNGPTTGSFIITDSNGVDSAVNLVADDVATVGELIEVINGLSVDVTASLNEAGDGIAIVDNAGGAETLTIADTGNGDAAALLGIAGTATDQSIGGATVSALVGTQDNRIEIEATDSLTDIVEKINATDRYADASVQINDDGSYSLRVRSKSAGAAGRFGVSTSGFNFDVETTAEAKDAIISVSTDGGTERIFSSADGVFDIDSSAAESANISTATKLSDFASATTSGSFTITDSAGVTSAINVVHDELETVGDLINRFNSLNIGVSASLNEDSTGINLIDKAGGDETLTIKDVGNGIAAASLGIAGEAAEQTIDGVSELGFVSRGDRASADEATGLSVTLKQLSADPITINVEEDTSGVVRSAKLFVEQYNKLIEKVESLTFFNSDTNEVGLLFGSSEAQRIRSGYSRLLSGAVQGAGNIKSVAQVGIRFDENGKLSLNETKLNEAIADNRQDVDDFFTTTDTGLANRLNTLADSIAGADSSLLINRTETIGTQINRNNTRIESLNGRLEKQRERLLLQFYRTEEAIAKIQSNQSAINQISPISIPT